MVSRYLNLTLGLYCACAAFAGGPIPPDDQADEILSLGVELGRGSSPSGQADACVVHISARYDGDCARYLGQVTNPIRGARLLEELVFVEMVGERPEDVQASVNGLTHTPPPRSGLLRVGGDYLVVYRLGSGPQCADAVDPRLAALPVIDLLTSRIVQASSREIFQILPQLRSLSEIMDGPAQLRGQRLRALILPLLTTGHGYLRHLITGELAYNVSIYSGMSNRDAHTVAAFSESVRDHRRFTILRNVALFTPHAMDQWYLRAVSSGTPFRLQPGDAANLGWFEDSLTEVVSRLSIDSFWPMLERPTREMNMWVRAFAHKSDPRLLPYITRHLENDHVDSSVIDALGYYKGSAVATEAVVEVLHRTKDLGGKSTALSVARKALQKIGTPKALQEAFRLGSLVK